MSKQPRIYLSLFATLLVFSIFGCEKVINVDLPDYDPELVINASFAPDTLWQVQLSKSVTILSNDDPEFVDNATVLILDDEGAVVDTLEHRLAGIYTSLNSSPVAGKTYTIEVTAPDFPTATATNHCPLPVTFLQATLQDSVSNNPDGFAQAQITIDFDDEASVENYYLVSLFTVDTATNFMDTIVFFSEITFTSQDPVIQDAERGAGGVLSDDSFNGQRKTLKVEVDYFYLENNEDLLLVIANVTQDFYLYHRSVTAQLDGGFNPFAEPVQLHDNVTNGLGIFAGSTPAVTLVQ